MNERRLSCQDVCERAVDLFEIDPEAVRALDAERIREITSRCEGPEWEALRKHLLLCPPCLEYVRQLGLTVDAVRCLPTCPAESVRAGLMEIYERWTRSRQG